MIKEDPGNVHGEIKRLEKIGFVKAHKTSNTNVYTANQKFSMYRELQSIVLKSQVSKRR